VIVTLRVVDAEEYRVLLTDPGDIRIARDHLAGRPGPRIPNGRVIRGANDVNTGHQWSIDPNDFEWADVTIEVCDGRPSDVDRSSWNADRYCPWSATVVKIEPAP
jgi:hypothetical protein